MKKIISVVVALAMVLVMSVSAFAAIDVTTPKPATPNDVDGWSAYYTELLGYAENEADAEEVINIMFGTFTDESVDMETFMSAFIRAFAAAELSPEARQNIMDAARKLAAEQDIPLPEFPPVEEPTLPELTLPDFGDFTLPDIGSLGDSDFINTILGVLSGLGDLIFGTGSDDTEDPTSPDDKTPWEDDDKNDEDFNNGSLGDTSVTAVATVAVVAAAAFVLTRKKSKDAE